MKNVGGIQVPETEGEKKACLVRMQEIETQNAKNAREYDTLILALKLAKTREVYHDN